MKTLTVSCAIRGCLKFADVDYDAFADGRRFALCPDCETSIILDSVLNMEQTGAILPTTTANFAGAFNGWRRRRNGVSITHRSGVVTSLEKLTAQNVEAPRDISGKN